MFRLSLALFTLLVSCVLNAQTPADSLAITSTKWVTDTVAPGVLVRIGHFEDLYGEPQNIVCFEINSQKRKLAIGVNSPVETTGVSASNIKALAAVNGSFFDMRKGNSVCYLKIGPEVCDTTAGSNPNYNGALIVTDGIASLKKWNKNIESEFASTSPVSDALVSGPMLVEQNRLSDIPNRDKSFSTTHHPRTGIGIKDDGSVILVTVDGRRPGFAGGMSLPCFAHLLKTLGAVDALNLDGGGSTTAWASHLPYGGIVNRPSSGRLRRVANIVYTY